MLCFLLPVRTWAITKDITVPVGIVAQLTDSIQSMTYETPGTPTFATLLADRTSSVRFAPWAEQDFGLDNTAIAENQPAGTVVGTFTRDDRYVLDGGANENLFAISGRSLTINQPLNFEDPAQQTLEVRVERRYGLFNLSRESETFTITVTNVEEPPTGVTLAGGTVAEGAPVGTSVGTLAAIGGAPEVPVTFALVAGVGGEDNALFTIVGDQLQINQVPDFETKNQYNVLVQAVGDGASPAQAFVISVTNAAEPPTNITLSNAAVAEGQPVETSVGVLSVEGGADTEIVYSLSGAEAAAFGIVGNTLVTRAILDFETQPSYAITVTASGDGEFSQDFVITVTNVAEPPTAVVLDNDAVAEGAPIGTAVGTLSASGGEPATVFELVPGAGADDNGSFVITDGVLQTSEVFDFETKNSYTIRVRATGDGFFEQALIITITDQPDPPNAIQLTSASVREAQPTGIVVGELSASGGSGPYTFALAGNQANNASFAVEGTELRTARPLNFEVTPTLEIVVRASNADGNFDQPFTITVVNEEEPPTAIALSSSAIRENAPAETTVGVLSATGGVGPIVFDLVGGEGGADNSRFEIVGNELRSRAPFNFEAQSEYSIRVRATGDGSYSQPLTITIVNEPEPPTEILLSSDAVLENQPVGAVVGELSTVGGAGPFTFSLVGNSGGNSSFQIEERRLLTNAEFDHEARASYPIRIRASGDGSLVADFTITIRDVDEAPVLSEIEDTFLEYAEQDEAKTITETIRIADPDSEELTRATVSFSGNTYVPGEDELIVATDGVDAAWFPSEGRLVIEGPLPRAQMQSILRTVQYNNLRAVNPTASTRRVSFQVNDGTGVSNQQERFIRVSDSNIPPVLADIIISTNEDNAVTITQENFANAYGGDEDGTGFLGSILVTTLPLRGTLTVGGRVLTDEDIGREGFEVNVGDGTTLEYTPQDNYFGTDNFQWTARDNQNDSGIPAEVTLSILPVNDAPVVNAPAAFNVEENTEDPLDEITVAEPDNDSVLITLTVDQGALTIAEAIRSDIILVTGTGEGDPELAFVGTASSLNDALANLFYLPAEGSATLTVTVTDTPDDGSAPLTATATVTLTVIPQNDDPVLAAISPETLVFTENSEPLALADSIRVTDEENDRIIAAVVAIDSGYAAGDSLLVTGGEPLTATFTEGTLTLTGTASVADYQRALRSVAFQNISDQPATALRTVRLEVTDATGGRSNALTRTIEVVPVEDTLRIIAIEPEPLYFVIGGSPVTVSRSVRLDDPDSETMDQLVVTITPETYVAADDSLGIVAGEGIAADWNAATGTLTLTGAATLAEYEQSLRTLTYVNRNPTAPEGSRLLQIQGFSGETRSNVATRDIQIINNIPPVVTDASVVALAGAPYAFAASVFQEQYGDEDNGPAPGGLTSVRITSLPRNGTLLFDGSPVTQRDIDAGLIIAAVDLPLLTYVSNQGYLGEDQFAWNASDGAEFADNPAQVNITVADLRVTLGEDREKCLNVDSLQLEATVEGGTPPYRYIWSSDQEESISKNSSIVAVLPSETSVYTVAVTDANDITVADTVRVTVVDCPEQELNIPSAFTPDGDGVNDEWEVGNILTYESSVVEIYDRYGHRLFRSEGYDQPWDGRYQGKELPVGTYYYTITLNDGVAHYKGSVTILK